MNECARKQKMANLSAIVTLVTSAGKGCDRETFEASDVYTICGASDFIDLLPKPGTGREWTKSLKISTKKYGGKGKFSSNGVLSGPLKSYKKIVHANCNFNNYLAAILCSINSFPEKNGFFFDGKTYAEIPDDVVPDDIGDKFTISTWVKVGLSKGRQTILANTDKERLDRVHFSLSTSGTKLLFVHRRESIHASRDLYCNAEFQYKPAIFDAEWHHITVVADGCAAKLFIDGVHQSPVVSTPDWTLHKSNLKNRLSVGARYLAKEGVYSEKFTGYLSGLAIRPNSTLDDQVWCMCCGANFFFGLKIFKPVQFLFSFASDSLA